MFSSNAVEAFASTALMWCRGFSPHTADRMEEKTSLYVMQTVEAYNRWQTYAA
ncbi:MAG: hypothetical protein NC453_24005 [Muribaculum sp.]|nr:hypothetical protein [Muribaculum sp.]